MSILLVRHGETEGNAAQIFQSPDAPLSSVGKAQAQRLAERIAASGVTRIITSDFVRAVETASYVSRRTGVALELDAVLRERDFGDLRGMRYDAVDTNPFAPDYVPPNGESWAAFRARVALAWERIARLGDGGPGNLLVVTHGLFCHSLVERHLALPPGTLPPAFWKNSSLTEIDPAPPWTVRRMNCVSHLASDR